MMRLIDADLLVKHLEEVKKTADDFGNYERSMEIGGCIAIVKAEKTVMENGDVTPKEALDATARLIDRVLEILPNIMQSVIDAMPDAIEKYLKERDEHEID